MENGIESELMAGHDIIVRPHVRRVKGARFDTVVRPHTRKLGGIDLAYKRGPFWIIDITVFHPTLFKPDLISGFSVGREEDEDKMEDWESIDEDVYFYLDDATFNKLRRGKLRPGSLIELDEPCLLIGVDVHSIQMSNEQMKERYKKLTE